MSARIRPPAVAGVLYPDAAEPLRAAVEELLGPPLESTGPAAKAVVAPHASLRESGPVAARAFRALAAAAGTVRRVVLVGPSHFVPIQGLGLPGVTHFSTPLGEVTVEPAGAIAALRLPQVRLQPEAHVREHSLEVELPFLQVLLGPDLTVVPLVVGEATEDEVAEVLDRLWGGPETLVVVSSDLSHFLPFDEARRIDRATAEQILALAGPLAPWQACAAPALNGLLAVARRRGLSADLLDLRNSGDTGGDSDRVVGYGAFAFREPRA